VPYGQGYHLGRPGRLPQRTPIVHQADPCPALPPR
jgi:hypothetical protein